MENRKAFYDKEINTKRAEEALHELAKKCTFSEICWIFRNICYDQVAYYSEYSHSKIYDEKDRTELNVEQANRLQQQISTIADLFEQSILNKREFDENYLKQYEFAGPYLKILREKNERIEQLEEAIKELNSKI